jgi:hypothetical protein
VTASQTIPTAPPRTGWATLRYWEASEKQSVEKRAIGPFTGARVGIVGEGRGHEDT